MMSLPTNLRDLLWEHSHAQAQIDEAFTRLAELQTRAEELSKRVRRELKRLPAGTVVEGYGTAYRLEGMTLHTAPFAQAWDIPIVDRQTDDGAPERRPIDDHDPASIDAALAAAEAPTALVGA